MDSGKPRAKEKVVNVRWARGVIAVVIDKEGRKWIGRGTVNRSSPYRAL
jgi:hypothetical protein